MSRSLASHRPRTTPVVVAVVGAVLCVTVGLLVTEPLSDRTLVAVGALAGGAALLALLARFGLATLGTFSMLSAAFVAPWNGIRLGSSAALTDGFLVVAAVLLLAELVVGHRHLELARPLRLVLVGLGLVVAGGLAGTFVASDDVSTSLGNLVRFGVAAAGTVVVVALWAPSRQLARTALRLWAVGSAANAVVGTAVTFTVTGRALGWSTHPNHLGLACVLGLTVALAELLTSSSRTRILWLAVLGLNVYGVLASGSRAALLGALVAGALVTWRLAPRSLAIVATTAVVMGVVLIAAGVLDVGTESSVGRLVGSESSQQSDADRADLIRETIDRGARSPVLGTGFDLALQGHNVYLQLWSSAGIVGLAGFGLVVLTIARTLLEALGRVAPAARSRSVLTGVVAGGVGYLIASAFQNVLWDRYLWIYFAVGLVLAVSVSAGVGVGADDHTEPPGQRARR